MRRALTFAVFLAGVATPAVSQDFLGRIAQSAAQTAAQRLANGAVDAATRPGPATPPAPRAGPAAPAPRPAAAPAGSSAPPEAPAVSGASITVRNNMAVISSDGVRVAETMHVPDNERTYAPDEMFFTADTTYRLRRIYAREVTVQGNTVRLKMSAAQYRARNQNPEHHPG